MSRNDHFSAHWRHVLLAAAIGAVVGVFVERYMAGTMAVRISEDSDGVRCLVEGIGWQISTLAVEVVDQCAEPCNPPVLPMFPGDCCTIYAESTP